MWAERQTDQRKASAHVFSAPAQSCLTASSARSDAVLNRSATPDVQEVVPELPPCVRRLHLADVVRFRRACSQECNGHWVSGADVRGRAVLGLRCVRERSDEWTVEREECETCNSNHDNDSTIFKQKLS